MSYRKMPTLIILSLILWLQNAVYSYKDNSLTAKDLLETIAPTYKQAKLPPGFPSLHSINTDKFDYKTSGDDIKVSAKLEKPVVMFPDYVTISSVEMNFTFNKKKPKNTAWSADVKGLWAIGSTILHVNITPNGTISGAAEKLELREIVSQLMKKDLKKNIGIDITALTLKNVKIKADILDNMSGLNLAFVGLLDHNSLDPIPIKIVMTKYSNPKPQLYSVIQFENISPEKVLKKLLNQKTLNIPFMAHMLAGSSLFSDNKDIFGLAFSYHEVYYYKENTISSTIIESVLQSHIPVGVTLLFPLNLSKTKLASVSDTVKIAFVINNSSFDLLIDKRDKIPVSQVLPILSKEFETTATDTIPNVMADLNDAFTTHLSFDSTSTMFSIFVRLTETVDLVKDLLRIKVTHLVLQRQIGLDDKNEKWKVAAKGIYTIGSSKLKVQYSELSNETGQPYGLTGIGDELSLEDIVSEFDPDFYPDGDSQEMIENTEIESLKIHKVRIYSRVPRISGTPHVLVTGYTNLPEFEKDIQIALLLLYKRKKWRCKWAASLKHSPLSNIIQAFTGFDSRNLKLLHNGHILTTIISSPLPSYTLLPPHIITTPLLRLPVKKALTLIALLRFPDNCGDDKMCESAAELLDPSKIYTVKGVISMNGFRLRSKIRYDLNFSRDVKGVNSTLQFTIGNNSKLDIITSLKLPRSDLVFDGFIHILKTGQFQLEMASRRKRWVEPFKMKSIVFENLKLLTTYETGINLDKLKLQGKVLLGTPGNGDEIETLLTLNYNPNSPYSSSFYGNYTDVKLDAFLTAFSIDAKLPGVLVESDFPTGLMLSYSGYRDGTIPSFNLHGEINIFGRLLNCHVFLPRDGNLRIVTENSPAPVIFAKGLIIIQADSKTKLRGPTIVANIDSYKANVTVNGFVKVLGIESDANIALEDKGVIFSVSGKLMDYKETKLTASSLDSTDSFQVYGCLEDLAEQVQLLLLEIVDKAANQSIVNMKKADQNYLSAQKHYELIDREEIDIRSQRDRARVFYEEHLLAYGRFEVKANDTCSAPKCLMKCFGCPKLQKCCRLDIFGHCISCSTWKSCCWKNINPLCIAKHDGCHVIKTVAERDLTEKEAQLIQQRIILDNLEQHVTKTEVNKGKHKAVLEAATDAKQIVEEDSSPGLNAHDAIRNFGTPFGWAKINSVCYNTSIEQAATGCMKFQISTNLFGKAEKNITIWSCLKGDLVTEVTESLANYIFPKIIDTSADSITEVAAQLNSAEIDKLKISSSAPEIVNDLLVPSNVEKPDGEINTMPAPNKQGDGEQYSMPAPSKQGDGELYTMSAPSKQGDGELLHDALGDGTQYANDQVNAQAPPNSIDANGKPQVTLIDTSRLGDYVRQPNEDEEDSSASGEEGTASGEEGTDEELKELYDNETRVDINNANSAKISNSNSGDDDMLAKEIVEQEEVDEENNEDTEKNEKSAKKKKNKKNKKNNRKLRIFQQKPAAEYTNTEFNSPVQNKNDSTLFNSNMSSQTNWYPPYPPYPSRNFTQNKTYYTPANSYATQNQNQSVYQNPAYNFNAEMLKYNPSSYYPNGNQATSQETPYSIYNRNQYTSSPSTAKPGLNFNGNQPVPSGTNTGNYTSSNQAATSVGPFNRTGNPFFTGYTQAVIDTLNGATQQLNTPFAATYGVNSVPQANTYSNPENDASNQKSSVPKTRKRRSLETTIRSRLPLTLFHSPKSRILFSNPFWDIKSDRSVTSTRSNIPLQPHRQKLMKNVIHKRWKIPDNSNGRCHIFHQLIAICKDMAETIVMLEKSIKDSRSKFQEEDKDVYLELFETEDFLVDAAKRINVSDGLMIEAGKTLDVVRQGVNIWSKRCSNEFEWQNEAGVQTWLQAMDLRIQQLGGYGVYRFLENLFHAFEALFEALTYSNSSTAKDALTMLQRIRRISNSFDKIFRNKLSVMKSRVYADRILKELANLRKDTTFC